MDPFSQLHDLYLKKDNTSNICNKTWYWWHRHIGQRPWHQTLKPNSLSLFFQSALINQWNDVTTKGQLCNTLLWNGNYCFRKMFQENGQLYLTVLYKRQQMKTRIISNNNMKKLILEPEVCASINITACPLKNTIIVMTFLCWLEVKNLLQEKNQKWIKKKATLKT